MDDVDRLRSVYRGAEGAYGVCIPNNKLDERGKTEPRMFTKKEKVTRKLWENHVNGICGLGIVPIFDKDKCVWGCIDIDKYPAPLEEVLTKIKDHRYPLNLCRSKSNGLHAFLFVKEPILADQMHSLLASINSKLAIPGVDCIFPKQSWIDNVGNWVNMPYFGDTRWAVGPNGGKLTLAEFLDNIKWTDPVELEEKLRVKDSPLGQEAPPCLQWMIEDGKVKQGKRNIFLANIAVLYKKEERDNLQGDIRSANDKFCSPPLLEDEVLSVYKSITKKPYNYQCSQLLHCDKPTCEKRKYGIGNGPGSIDEELIVKYQEDEGFAYEIKFRGKEKTMLCDEEQYAYQPKYRVRYLTIYDEMPPKLNATKWDEHVNKRKSIILYVPQEPGMRKVDRLRMLLTRYKEHFITTDQNKIYNDKPGAWVDKHDRLNFPKTHFLEWLQTHKYDFSSREIVSLLKEISGLSDVSAILKIGNRSVRVHRISISCLDEHEEDDHDEGEPL